MPTMANGLGLGGISDRVIETQYPVPKMMCKLDRGVSLNDILSLIEITEAVLYLADHKITRTFNSLGCGTNFSFFKCRKQQGPFTLSSQKENKPVT
jgi:hypothetical protein